MNRNGRRAFRLAYAAWLFGAIAFFMPAPTWNPISRLDLTRAIVERHTLSIDAYASSTGDRSLVQGQWFTDKAPMPSLVAVPVYGALRAVQTLRGVTPQYRAFGTATTPAIRVDSGTARSSRPSTWTSLMTAGIGGVAIGLLLFELLRRRTSTSFFAFVASAVGVLGTPILPYATSFYGHVPAGAALLGALVALDTRGHRWSDSWLPRWRVRLAGLCLALAPGCEYITAGPAALIGLVFLLRTPRPALVRTLLDLAVGALGPVLLVSTYHTAVFGAPWRTGYSFIARPEFAAGHAHGLLGINLPRWEGLVGLSVGTRRGLFYLSPALVVGLFLGAQRAVRTRDRTVLVGLAAFVMLLMMNAGYYMWWGGASGGPRHLVLAIAILAVGLYVALRRRPAWIGTVTGVPIAVSVANCLALALVGIEAPEQGNILSEYVWPALGQGRVSAATGATNIGMKLGLSRALSPLALFLWLGLGYAYLSRQLRPRRQRARVRLATKNPSPERLGAS